MKAQTLKNRLEKVTKIAKNSKAYQIVSDVVNGANNTRSINGNMVRPCHTSGSGRFTTNLDYTSQVMWLFDQLNIKYKTGNDSVRGGLTGNYIKILTKIER